MSELLGSLARSSGRRCRAARRRVSESELRRRARYAPSPPPLVLDREGFDLIAEVKRRAPSAGTLVAGSSGDARPRAGGNGGHRARIDIALRQARSYVDAGAVAISVLTEPEAFDGSLDDLSAIAGSVPVPVMRKDFLIDPYQILESRAAGASGVLLIARILDDGRLAEMLAAAAEMELFVLLEAFDESDLERAATFATRGGPPGMPGGVSPSRHAPATAMGRPPVLVGVNARDLSTLEVDPSRFARLRALVPPGQVAVAESGLASAQDAARVAACGYRVALVGTALMRSGDPGKLAAAMVAAGRAAAPMRRPAAGRRATRETGRDAGGSSCVSA